MNQTKQNYPRSILHAHGELLKALRGLESVIGSTPAAKTSRWLSVLENVQASVLAHFEMEEAGGYMSDVLKHNPHLNSVVQDLRNEHDQLRVALAGVIHSAKAGAGDEETFREALRQWIARMRRHEARENVLVEDAYNRDLGAED